MKASLGWFCAGLLLLAGGSASAQDYPSALVRIVVPFTAGSGTDAIARIVGDGLAKRWGKPVIVDNRPGASGQLGTAQAAAAAPDGHTLLISSSSTHSANPALFKTLPYDPIAGFTHVAPLVRIPFALVTTTRPAVGDLPALVAFGRAHPGKLLYGYGTPTSQVAGATFARLAKIEAVAVPYRSQPPALTDLVSGQIQFMFADLSVARPLAASGDLRALAVAAEARSPLLPDVPTMAELGFADFDMVVWIGLSAPAGLPKPLLERIGADVAAIVARPDTQDRLREIGMTPVVQGPSDFAAFVQAQLRIWGDKIAAAGLQPE